MLRRSGYRFADKKDGRYLQRKTQHYDLLQTPRRTQAYQYVKSPMQARN
jgi:hypothetical protein